MLKCCKRLLGQHLFAGPYTQQLPKESCQNLSPRYMDWYNTGSQRSTKSSLKNVKHAESLEAEVDQGEDGKHQVAGELVSVESTPREMDQSRHDDTESG